MKKVLVFTTIIVVGVVMLLLLNELLNYRKYLPKLIQQIDSLQEQLFETERNIFVPLKFQDFSLDPIKNDTLSLADKFVLIFPEDICNVCYEKVFYNMSELSPELKEKIVAIVPPKFRRKFSVYNNTYQLNVGKIVSIDLSGYIPSSMTGELILFYSSTAERILAPVVLNAKYYDVKSYIETIGKKANQ